MYVTKYYKLALASVVPRKILQNSSKKNYNVNSYIIDLLYITIQRYIIAIKFNKHLLTHVHINATCKIQGR